MQEFIEILKQLNVSYTLENDKLTINDDLDLSHTQIKELPKGLTVDGTLYLCNTQIKELPDDLTVGGSLELYGTQIKEF